MAAVQAFNQESFATDSDNADVFESVDARLLRYAVNQAYYDNTVFSNIHNFAQGIKTKSPALYKYVQTIYNPSYRLAQVYRMNVWGGLLDPDAGNKGAIPIVVGEGTNEELLRAAIKHLWEISNWATNKTILPLQGAVLGDCAIIVRDLPDRAKARIEILHPSIVEDAELDGGFVKFYKLSETRLDNEGKAATYSETCERGDGEDVIFQTFRDDKPYAWAANVGQDGQPRSEWTEVYGFIPLVLIQHDNIGLAWGMAEGHVLQPKINGVEDMASALHDHVRKAMAGIGLLAGVPDPQAAVVIAGQTATSDKPEPVREQQNLIYSDDSSAHFDSMTFPLDIPGVSAEIQNAISDWEKDYPELRSDIWQADTRVEGVKAAREQVEAKIVDRRAPYDSGLVRAMQMAIAIGGMRGYPGFEGFNLDTYKAGKMNFRVAARPVFKVDSTEQFKDTPTQVLALSKLRLDNPGLLPDSFYQERIGQLFGKSEKEIQEMADAAKNEQARGLDLLMGAAGNAPVV